MIFSDPRFVGGPSHFSEIFLEGILVDAMLRGVWEMNGLNNLTGKRLEQGTRNTKNKYGACLPVTLAETHARKGL